MLSTTAILLIVRRTITADFWLQAGMQINILKYQDGIGFYEIEDLVDVNDYILYSFGRGMFAASVNESYPNAITKRFHPSGNIRFRQLRTKPRACKHQSDYKINLTCYDYTYSQSTKQTTNLANDTTDKPWLVYHDTTSAPSAYTGVMNTYDVSGYYFDVSQNISLSEFQNFYQNIMNDNWLDQGTRGLFITANYYLPNSNQFMKILVLIESNPVGEWYPSWLQASSMIVNFYTGSTLDNGMLAVEIIRSLCSFYFIFLYIKYGRQTDKDNLRHVGNWIAVKNVTNLLIFGMALTVFIYSFLINKNHEAILSSGYYDLEVVYQNYFECVLLNAWLLLIVSFRLLVNFRFSTEINLYIHTVELSAKNIIYYMFILLPLIVSMSVLSSEILGPYNFYYRLPKFVAISNVLFCLGYGDIQSMLYVSPSWVTAFLFVYFFILMFFLYSAYLGIIIDSYRVSELRNHVIVEEMKKYPEYKPWKIWLSYPFRICKKKVEEENK